MFSMLKKKTYPPNVLKLNSNREKQIILLMIPNEKKALSCTIGIIKRNNFKTSW